MLLYNNLIKTDHTIVLYKSYHFPYNKGLYTATLSSKSKKCQFLRWILRDKGFNAKQAYKNKIGSIVEVIIVEGECDCQMQTLSS